MRHVLLQFVALLRVLPQHPFGLPGDGLFADPRLGEEFLPLRDRVLVPVPGPLLGLGVLPPGIGEDVLPALVEVGDAGVAGRLLCGELPVGGVGLGGLLLLLFGEEGGAAAGHLAERLGGLPDDLVGLGAGLGAEFVGVVLRGLHGAGGGGLGVGAAPGGGLAGGVAEGAGLLLGLFGEGLGLGLGGGPQVGGLGLGGGEEPLGAGPEGFVGLRGEGGDDGVEPFDLLRHLLGLPGELCGAFPGGLALGVQLGHPGVDLFGPVPAAPDDSEAVR
ncbi:hypothetical protein STAL104432_30965 [Streptomyces albus]